MGCAILLAAFSIGPTLANLDRSSFAPGAAGLLRLDFDALGRVLGLVPYAPSHAFGVAQGAVWWILGGAAGLASLHPSRRAARPLAVGLCASVLCVLLLGERGALGISFFLLPLCAVALEGLVSGARALGLPWTSAIPALARLDHAVDCVRAAAAHSDYLYDCADFFHVMLVQ